MSLFDLLFLFVILSSLVTLICIFVALLRGRRTAALRAFRTLGIALGVYLLVVTAAALTAPQRVLKVGEDRCFDEMCFAPTAVHTTSGLGPAGRQVKPAGTFYLVSVRVSNLGRGRAQREAGVSVSLIDAQGRTYIVSPQGQQAYEAAHGPSPALTSRLEAGASFVTVLVFDIPQDATRMAVHFGHDGPGLFIIGDDESPLHKPTITELR